MLKESGTCSDCRHEKDCDVLKELKEALKEFEAAHEYTVEVKPHIEYCDYGQVIQTSLTEPRSSTNRH